MPMAESCNMRGESPGVAVVLMIWDAFNCGLQPSKKDHHSNTALDYGLQPSKNRSSLEDHNVHAD